IECAKKNHVVLLEAIRPDFDPAFDMIKNALPRIGKIRRASFEFCQYSSRYDRFKDGIIEM
ncbi:gfo/Idh/MocA family oxidoreductase, partial [[Ruminococcus] torques]|nr:gfo/Idh/MocA family oxidoreductase [[Ruminococcus] torques]